MNELPRSLDYMLAATIREMSYRRKPMNLDSALSLNGSVALVTGGSRGIGYGIAATLTTLGANVVITGKNANRVTAAARELSANGAGCEGVVCDVTSLPAVDAFAKHVRDKYGRIHILVNNAGIGGPASLLHELPPEKWDEIFDTNVRGVFYMVQAIVPLMLTAGSGHIVNISSLAGKNPLPRGACLFVIQVGTQRTVVFARGGATRAEHTRQRRMPRIGRHRVQPTHRQEHRSHAPSRRHWAYSRHAGHAADALVRERGARASDAKAMIPSLPNLYYNV